MAESEETEVLIAIGLLLGILVTILVVFVLVNHYKSFKRTHKKRKLTIKWKQALSVAIFAAFSGLLIFLMIEAIWAQILKDTIIEMYEGNDVLVVVIILSGFLISMLISIFAALLSSQKYIKKYSYYAALLALICNLFLWILISYFTILVNAPAIIDNMSFIQRILNIPQIITYYSIYQLSNVTLLWLFSQITFAFLFSLYLVLLGSKTTRRTTSSNLL